MALDSQSTMEGNEFETRLGNLAKAIPIPGTHLFKIGWDKPGPLPEEMRGVFTQIKFVEQAVNQWNARRDNADAAAAKQKQVKLRSREEERVFKIESENRALKQQVKNLEKILVTEASKDGS